MSDKKLEAYFNGSDNLCNYLGGEIYCREERQFAALLYSVFLEKKRKKENADCFIDKIVGNCLGVPVDKCKKLVIDNVYFEATLMRDYFENAKDKEVFNKKLLTFCLGWWPDGKDRVSNILGLMRINCNDSRNLGQGKAKKIIEEQKEFEKLKDAIKSGDESIMRSAKVKTCLDIASMMMNATPDILVVYKFADSDSMYAKALECKYLSDEGPYVDIAGSTRKMQCFIQECIMHFCFGKKRKMDGKYDDEIKCSKELLVFPERSKIWGDNNIAKRNKKEKIWNYSCKDVYKNILEQESPSCDVINTGVKIVRFKTNCNEIKEDEIPINVSVLEKIYRV